MKNNTIKIVAAIVCVLLVFNTFKIIRLQNEIDNLRSNLYGEMNVINNEISSVYASVNDMLEKEASQLSLAEWEYGNINVANKTADVKCMIVPKVYDPENTKVTIVCDGLLACRCKKDKMTLCRNLLGCEQYISKLRGKTVAEKILILYKHDITKCKCCGEPVRSYKVDGRYMLC